MGSVFVTSTSDPEPEEVEGRKHLARVAFGGTYFFLYPAILHLRDQTGQLIDPQKSAFFVGPTLDQLEVFIASSLSLAAAQPDAWRQRVGTRGDTGEVIHETATRNEVLQFLGYLAGAVRSARERQMGVLFLGE